MGTVHDMRFVFLADAQAGREFLRRLTPHVDSAADWWQAGASWISVAISYAGLVALGVAEDSLRSFPEAFRVGMPAKLVGRWRSGAPLTLAPAHDDPELGADPRRNNDFTYAADPDGQQVPLGSHMRRMNPRDTKLAILTDVNLHRIIRRSTAYGPPYDPDAISPQDDQTPHGLYFIFLSAKAMATLEFLQQEWINNGNFMSLGEERDPNVGRQEQGATFTIPQEPVRRRIHGIETFNVLRGGEYFFLPSLSALSWLGKKH